MGRALLRPELAELGDLCLRPLESCPVSSLEDREVLGIDLPQLALALEILDRLLEELPLALQSV